MLPAMSTSAATPLLATAPARVELIVRLEGEPSICIGRFCR
jgi:hypothetical protein